MAAGISMTNVANVVLNWLRGVAPPPVPGLYIQLHVGDTGPAGTANPSAVTTRVQATENPASGGAMTLASVSGSWTMTATESISHISAHNAAVGGDFLWSAELVEPRDVVNGDTMTLTVLTVDNDPLAV